MDYTLLCLQDTVTTGLNLKQMNPPTVLRPPWRSALIRPSDLSLSYSSSDQNYVRIFHSFHACYMPCLGHSSWFHSPNDVGWRAL